MVGPSCAHLHLWTIFHIQQRLVLHADVEVILYLRRCFSLLVRLLDHRVWRAAAWNINWVSLGSLCGSLALA